MPKSTKKRNTKKRNTKAAAAPSGNASPAIEQAQAQAAASAAPAKTAAAIAADKTAAQIAARGINIPANLAREFAHDKPVTITAKRSEYASAKAAIAHPKAPTERDFTALATAFVCHGTSTFNYVDCGHLGLAEHIADAFGFIGALCKFTDPAFLSVKSRLIAHNYLAANDDYTEYRVTARGAAKFRELAIAHNLPYAAQFAA